MSAPVSAPASQSISARLRRVIATLVQFGMIRSRNADDAAATSYHTLLRQSFGTTRGAVFARLSRAEVRKIAPALFREVFDDVPAEAARSSVAASILGVPGILLMVAVIVSVAICIDVQLLQSSDRSKGATSAPAASKPADRPASDAASPAKGVTLPDLDPPSKLRPNSANQAAPRPAQPSGNASSLDAQPQQPQLDPRK